jgi:hypothetical protein
VETDREVDLVATGEETAIIKMTTEEARGTIMTEVVTEIDKEGMRIASNGEDIMTTAVEATIITMIGGVEVEEEITTEEIDKTMVDMVHVEVAAVATVVADMVIEEDEINQEAMRTSV